MPLLQRLLPQRRLRDRTGARLCCRPFCARPPRPQGRGTVVTGRVEQGIVKTGDNVEIVGIRPSTTTTVTGEGGLKAVCTCGCKSGVHFICDYIGVHSSAAGSTMGTQKALWAVPAEAELSPAGLLRLKLEQLLALE